MKKVVIIGASFAGLRAYTYLKKHADVDLTLIDKAPVVTYIPSLHLVLNRPDYLSKIQIPLADFYEDFVQDEVSSVTASRVVGASRKYSYDFLIVASGAPTNFFGNESFQKYAFSAKSALELDAINKKLPDAKNVVIVGGGLSGVEYAGVLASETDKNITLISATDRLLPGLNQKASSLTKKYLEKQGVNVLLSAFADKATKKSVVLKDGTKIPSDLTMWCAGISQHCSFISEKISSSPQVFFAGDVIRTNQVPTAHNAMLAGDAIAKTIISHLNGSPKVFPLKNWTTLAVALGRNYGLLCFGSKLTVPFPFTGLAKTIIEKRIMYEWKKKKLLYI